MKCDYDFIHENIEIRPSPGKGRGFFAKQTIQKDTLIVISKAIVIIYADQHSSNEIQFIEKQLAKNIKTYPAEHVQAYNDLYGGPYGKRDLVSKFNYNSCRCYPRLDVLYNPAQKSPDIGLFTYLSYFNHSCVPNCTKYFIKDHVYIRVNKTINADEEIFISYVANERNFFNLQGRASSLQKYFSKCACELCSLQETDRYKQYQINLDHHLKLINQKLTLEELLLNCEKFFELRNAVLALNNPLFVLDGEMQAAEFYFEKLNNQNIDVQLLIKIIKSGFNENAHIFFKPDGFNVAKQMHYFKLLNLDQSKCREELEEFEMNRYGQVEHIEARYGKNLSKWTK
ncbi:SET_domain-containing protein [Hexamita inflata]|uniref:SET domain-containing protein n=1 Tax=Hexamita inflata TaxID=28002 RepID=A0AA86PVS4_9EUKA|nr:SET domain-containing protein [Hexamita inflata]